jgi:23S rRNA (uracil1939-C5)-methyltransferase
VSCPHAERCAGCTLLGVPYAEGLARKQARLAGALAAYPALSGIEIEPIGGATPVEGYRTRAKWMAGPGGALGLYARGGHDVVDIPGCRVVSPLIARVGAAVRALVAAPPEGASWLGALRAVDIREVSAGGVVRALVTLVVAEARAGGAAGKAAPSLAQARAAARALRAAEPAVAGVALNRTKADALQVLGPETVRLEGDAEAWDELGGGATLVTFGSFVQAHRGQAARVHAALADEATRGGRAARAQAGAGARADVSAGVRAGGKADGRADAARVLDLYGGSGAIAMSLAARGLRVDTVESFAPASAAAARAAAERRLPVRAIAGDAEQATRALVAEGAHYDLVVANPPRRGLSAGVREALSRLAPPRIAYVSCEPATLARDLEHLARLGFRSTRAWPLDMIPLTDEVETVAFLERGPLPPATILHREDDVAFVAKGPHEPTTPQGEYGSSLLARVRLLPGMAEAVPVHRLDVGTSGVCIFASSPAAVRPWSLALGAADARKSYLAGVRGVTSARGVISRPLRDGPRSVPAVTRYRRLAVDAGHAILEVWPEQGRTHQIRRHLEGLGHPILGDERYGHAPSNRFFLERHGLDRAFLHLMSISLTHPRTGQRRSVRCPPPGDLPLPAGLDLSATATAPRARPRQVAADRGPPPGGPKGQRDIPGENE